ncbi:hypothetical protein BT67DRAFT_444123 [Trichocladium antarcticum]|uniref:2EXR domain-containing protein n=1 Tax=Trichocladium antarcticum TaxID=1450529 RepID=A0AAN6UFX0_9PEZI|nr:hypothetical protein BT67DRAFT_444123 [Trichocladium antarcticum]
MSDTSGESDHITACLVQQFDWDESDDSSSESDTAQNGFLDLEAADSDASDSDSDGDDLRSDKSELDFFPQFARFPIELRQQIWESFCPDLTVKSRVFCFQLHRGAQVWEGPFLEQQTRESRAMLAVHHESRQFALKAFPDLLSFQGPGLVRFNAKRDLVFLSSDETVFSDLDSVPQIPGFSEHIHHLALGMPLFNTGQQLYPALCRAFENLKTVYYSTEPEDHKPEHLRWCTSNQANHYFLTTFEQEPGLGEDADHLFCWPDLENHPSFAENEIPLDCLADDLDGDIDIKGAQPNGIKFWPCVRFLWESDMGQFGKLLAWDGEEKMVWALPDGEGNDESDEYESEGIDDSDISEDGSGSDSDLVVLDHDDDASDGEEEGEEGSEDGSSVVSRPSLGQHHVEMIDLTADDDQSAPGFSSPEQSSSTARESDGSEPDQPASRISRLKRPRGRVVESDSDEDSEQDVPRKRARTGIHRPDIVLSDDDVDDERRKMRANRRTRAIISEDEDEASDQGGSNPGQAQDDGAGGGTDWSGISSSDEDEEPAGGAAIAKPLSLAEKLQLHRDKIPIPLSDDDDSNIEEMAGDDYDARDYADFQDDEEGNGMQESDDDDGGGLIMDDQDGEDDVDYGY